MLKVKSFHKADLSSFQEIALFQASSMEQLHAQDESTQQSPDKLSRGCEYLLVTKFDQPKKEASQVFVYS